MNDIDEIQLFKDEIKPALYINKQKIEKNNININDYYNLELKGRIILSYKPLPDIKNINNYSFGKILGYYPESCKLFVDNPNKYIGKSINEFINFNGLQFNTKGLYENAFKWCMQQYGEKVLKKYGRIQCFKQILKLEDKKVVDIKIIKYHVITRRNHYI